MIEAQHFIVATAGHVDHGKSALVKALTGSDPDRLPGVRIRPVDKVSKPRPLRKIVVSQGGEA